MRQLLKARLEVNSLQLPDTKRTKSSNTNVQLLRQLWHHQNKMYAAVASIVNNRLAWRLVIACRKMKYVSDKCMLLRQW